MSDLNEVSRKLVAVFAADVEGYSRLMGDDEVGTLKGLTERRAILDKLIGQYRGRIANTAGDSVLAEFGSAVEAVQCAVDAQTALAEANASLKSDHRISFRIGIHIGDVMIRAGDLFGDGVNIAARLQSIAKAGGVCISRATYDQVHKVLPMAFVDLGVQTVKNIQEPVRAYHVAATPTETQEAAFTHFAEVESPPPIPDKPSVAVLPFQNMSGDPEQAYFADGMVEEIITALSRFKSLFVIARNSSFTFKDRAVDIKDVGRALGVRYVLEGSVRKASGKVRITGQLIDAMTGAHLWADRFERDLADIFALQDEITTAVVSAIHPKLLQTEIATRRRPENLTAYDFFLRMMPQYYLATREGMAEAIRLGDRALELDPRYGFVAAIVAACHMLNILCGHSTDPQSDRAEAVRLLRVAMGVDDDDAEKLAFVAATLAFTGDYESSIEIADRSVALNSNSFHAWHGRGTVYRIAGLPEEAIRSQKIAMRLSPVDPLLFQSFNVMGLGLIELGRFDEAVAAAKRALRLNPSFPPAYYCLTSALAHLGREAEAREAAARLLQADPAFTIAGRIAGSAQSSKRIIEGLRKTELPE
ncbi:tetratricopeptide repeat protein [Bradyrhizobium manausense]|uniref:adenylate/guanylate cyclase domain-containing protein n=1 Tax=Bradyrhizobium manausense TaxID=989370 RepID=UPI001BAAC42E|nr:adenylate/guanylate cyclase domain-containing protein [Bradyrhizobium manausense]MBR0684521.1 tetratricopeptide repeat protein [Bradyrhizobium manausense]